MQPLRQTDLGIRGESHFEPAGAAGHGAVGVDRARAAVIHILIALGAVDNSFVDNPVKEMFIEKAFGEKPY